jgi:phage gpG-like protein
MAKVRGRITIEVEVKADDVIELLENMKDRADDMRPVFRWAKGQLELANAANFMANGLPSGKPWAPLDKDYGTWKSARFPGRGTMVQTGNLFRSLINMNDSAVNVIEKDTATFGTNVEYAKFHQYGTTKMPARKIVFTPREFPRELGINMVKYMVLGEGGIS